MAGILTRTLAPRAQRAVDYTGDWSALFAPDSYTGHTVTERSALQLPTVYACVRVLAESVAGLPLLTYRRSGDGKQRATDHPLYSVLRNLPNPEMTSFELREALIGHVALWGNAYCEIDWSPSGQVAALWPLRPDQMSVKREGGALVYEYQLPAGGVATLPAYRVFHLRGLSYNGLIGYSPIRMCMQSFGLSMAADEFGARFFGNNARPAMVLKYAERLSDEQRRNLRDSWAADYGGLSNAHRTAVLEHGIDVEAIGIPPEEAQFLETRKFQKTDIAGIFRVPPHMIADLERATFSNIEHQSIDFVVHSLRPWLVRFEQAVARDLMVDDAEREEYFVEHLVDSLLRGDTATRYQAYATGRTGGWLSVNDIRRLENMNLVDGGDTYLEPLNMVPVGDDVEAERAFVRGVPGGATREGGYERTGVLAVSRETRAGDEQLLVSRQRLARSYQHLYTDAAKRLINREAADLRRAVQTYIVKRDVDAFLEYLEAFYDDLRAVIPGLFEPAMRALADQVAAAVQDEIGQTGDTGPFIDEYLDQFAGRHVASHHRQLRSVIDELDEADRETVAAAVESRVDHWVEIEPEGHGRDQPFEAVNALAIAGYAAAGVQVLRWLATGDSCEFCQSLSGKTVGINGYFVNKGGTLGGVLGGVMNVGANRRHAPLHDGCDCIVVAG